MTETPQRLIVASNRLPFVIHRQADGGWKLGRGSGGLVTALAPVLRNRGGLWIGWTGLYADDAPDMTDLLRQARDQAGFDFVPVPITAEEFRLYYNGYANESLWPLFHDLQSQCVFHPSYWDAYQQVNAKFAGQIAAHTGPTDFVWIHDYQLMMTAHHLRQMGMRIPLGFFLHIPFPPPDIFVKLPQRAEMLNGLLQFDLLGFQTQRDRRNFIQCVRLLRREVKISNRRGLHTLQLADSQVNVGDFGIGIDYREFVRRARTEAVAKQAWYIHEALPGRQIVLGVDRLDYTKGIPQRLEAFRNLLTRYPDLHERINLIQIVVPSREGIPRYDALKQKIEGLVGEINGSFTTAKWVPIHYIYRSCSELELLAYYRTAEIALVTPLKDGMNLVSKEYCACSLEENSVLILSQFAGSAAQLSRGAILVNPYDVEEMADAIYRAFHMPFEERRGRMRHMRRIVRRHDVFDWVDSFIYAAINRELASFPVHPEYYPGAITQDLFEHKTVMS